MESISITLEFKSEKNWRKVYDIATDNLLEVTSYGYKAITAFGEKSTAALLEICKKNRVAFIEI